MSSEDALDAYERLPIGDRRAIERRLSASERLALRKLSQMPKTASPQRQPPLQCSGQLRKSLQRIAFSHPKAPKVTAAARDAVIALLERDEQ